MADEPRRGLLETLADNSLSIALFSLFAICVVAQAFTGWRAYGGALQQAHLPSIGFRAYLGTGEFLSGVFSNWQAAILQLAVLIAFSAVLRQRGAAHSRKPAEEKASSDRDAADQGAEKSNAASARATHAPTRLRANLGVNPFQKNWLYDNSLSLAMFSLFGLFFALHLLTSERLYNEEQALKHLPPETLGAYFASWDFWVTVFQTWEAEFFAIGLYIVLSIFLRQENSSESKRIDCSNEETGETNE